MDPDEFLAALKKKKLKSTAPPPEPKLIVEDNFAFVPVKPTSLYSENPGKDIESVPQTVSASLPSPPLLLPLPLTEFVQEVHSPEVNITAVSVGVADDEYACANEHAEHVLPSYEAFREQPESQPAMSILDQLRKINNAAVPTPIRVNTSPISGLSASTAKSRRKGRDLDHRELEDNEFDGRSQNDEPNVFVSPDFLSSGADFHTADAYVSSPGVRRSRSPGRVRRTVGTNSVENRTGNRVQNSTIINEIIQLRESNHNESYDIDYEIINNPHYSLDSLRRAGYSVQLLHKCGRFTGYAMRNEGNFTVKELLDSGCYLLTECKRVGYTAWEVKESGLPLSALLLVGYELADLLAAGYSLKELRNNKVKVADLRVLSTITVKDLIDAGYTGVELRCAGYTAAELVHFYGHTVVNTVGDVAEDDESENENARDEDGSMRRKAGGSGVSYVSVEKSFDNLKYLTDSGFNARELKDAGYTAKELKSVGFSYSHVRGLGFSVQELVSSGYHQEIERQVLEELYHVTNGANWIHSFNWCVEGTELRDWYGVTMDPFSNRVIRIALNNNNLTGTLPNSLSLLHSCQSLAFQNNLLDFDSKVVSNFTTSVNGKARVVKSPVKSPMKSIFGGNINGPAPLVFNRAVLNILQLPQLQYINLMYNYEEGDTLAMHATSNSFDNQYHFELTTRFAIQEFVEEIKTKLSEALPLSAEATADNTSVISGRSGGVFGTPNSGHHFNNPISSVKNKSAGVGMNMNGSVTGSVVGYSSVNDADDKQQKDALIALFYSTNGHNWKNKQNWCKMHVPLNQWYGITTNSHNYITKINLSHNNLKGTIPNEFYYLMSDFHDIYATKFSYLTVLDLRYNSIHGPILTNIISLRESLKELHLHSNRFSGNAFEWLPQLTQLVNVDLKNNQFKDHLTEHDLKKLTALKHLTHLNATSNLQEYDIPIPRNHKSSLPQKPMLNKAKIVNAYVKNLIPWCTIVTLLK